MKLTLTKTKWHGDPSADRDRFIGGSDVGTIMGVNPWKSPYTLWAEKFGLVEAEDISDKEAVWWGTNMEDLVAKRFAMKYEATTGEKIKLFKPMVSYSCKEYPFLVGHVDRLFRGKKIGLECKTTSAYNKTDYNEGEIPPMHYMQCQFYMMVTGYREWYLATKRDQQFYITKVDYDETVADAILSACIRFWDLVQTGEAPPVDDTESTAETLAQIFPGDPDAMPADLTEYKDVLERRQTLDEQIQNLKDIKTLGDNQIKAAMGDSERGTCEGYTVSWKTNAKGTRMFRVTKKGQK